MTRTNHRTSGSRSVIAKPLSALLILATVALGGCSNSSDTPAAEPEAPETTTETTTVTPEPQPEPTSSVAEESAVTEPTAEEAVSPEVSDSVMAEPEAATTVPAPELSADAGKVLYEKQCKVCHEQGLLGAPKYGDKAAWEPRLVKGKPTLYEHSANGFNKMPAQAVNGVSEPEVHAAVDYMIAASS